jgi:hypothetical protein
MNRLLIFALGVLVGAGAVTYGPTLTRNARPLIKEALKTALQLAHGVRVQGAGLMESLEDIFAEVLAEAAAAPAAASRPRRARARKGPARRRAARAKAAARVAENA